MTFRKKLLAIVGFALTLLGAGQTGVIIGQGSLIKNFTADGGVSATSTIAFNIPVIADVTATGSLTVKTTNLATGQAGTKYASACIPNPLSHGSGTTALNAGSGILLRLDYHNIANPAAVGGDIGFVSDCNSSGTGDTIINNTCTATGCISSYTTGTAIWQGAGAKYIKLGLRGNPTAAFDARITLTVMDLIGE